MSEDPNLKQSLINAYYYLDMMHMLDGSRDRHMDVVYRDVFDDYIDKYDVIDSINQYEHTLSIVYKCIFNYLQFMIPKEKIDIVGSNWFKNVKEVHKINNIDYSDGNGIYIMGLRADFLNSEFEFNINKLNKLPFFRHLYIEHIFDTPRKIVIGTSGDVVRLFNQMVYFYAKASLYIGKASKNGLLLEMLLDSSERSAFTFVESFLESVGIDNLLKQGFKEPFTDVEPKRLECLLSAKVENNKLKYIFGDGIIVRLKKFIREVKNDPNYTNKKDYTDIIKRYESALKIRHLLTHSGHYRAEESETIMERKYTETFELLKLVLDLCKIIWAKVYDIDIYHCFYNFSFDKMINKISIDIQNELVFLKDIRKYEYIKPMEPRIRKL